MSSRYALALGVSVLAGGLVALQARINGEFGLALNNVPLAAFLSFFSALMLLTAILLFRKKAQWGVAGLWSSIRSGELPWWIAIGGVGGAFHVLAQGYSAGILGVALFTIAAVTGQTLGSLVIDTLGWFGAMRVRLTLWRVLGGLVVLAGVVTSFDTDLGPLVLEPTLLLVPFLAGMGNSFKQAANGRVRNFSGSLLSAVFVNFAVGTAVLAVLFAISLPLVDLPTTWPSSWWLWSGGALAAGIIAIQVSTVSIVGVMGLGVSLVTGQLMGSLLIDALAPLSTSHQNFSIILGALATLAGSALVALTRKPSPPAPNEK
tara:strand:+ start:471 stop:1424 length:954 start_codon:yes stop_codon:yes gene_type:complete